MTNNEKGLLSLIRESENKQHAMVTAAQIIATFLTLSVSYQEPSADSQRELV